MITRRIARPLGALSRSNWVCPSCAQTSFIQQHLPQRRNYQSVPPLDNYDQSFRTEGVPGLFTATGFSIGWTQYQTMITQKLNELTAGEPFENNRPKDLALQFARDPMNASLFNHASMAHNNHQFYSGLSTDPINIWDAKLGQLRGSLEEAFGSIDTLRTTMLDTAAAMFGPGFVWLVWARARGRNNIASVKNGEFRVLATYLAGTPYPEAGFRRQGIDMNTNNQSSYGDYQGEVANMAGAFGHHSAAGVENSMVPPGAVKVMPVLCVNTWEHVYIYDYGLPGKRKFLADWWDAVDWQKVSTRYGETGATNFL